jgi:hypothetical protein
MVILLAASIIQVFAQEREVFLREDFDDIEDWKPLHFQNIKEHTEYSVVKEGDKAYLKADSNASASGIVFKIEFSAFEYSKVRWRWKVSNVFEKGNAKEKGGDDYPLRVYIIFKYNPEKASLGQKIKYGLARKIYGEYPPHSTLNYIWANRRHREHILTNKYADESKMIILQSGPDITGKWIEQEINIIEDYHRAFGSDPPETASLAIMSDSDNTKESAVSYIDFIEVYK